MTTPEPLSPSPEIPEQFICTYDPKDHHAIKVYDGAGFHGDGSGKYWCDVHEIQRLNAALRASTTQAPEIRYQLRNWHHVNCDFITVLGACNCLAQREALIAELAGGES